MKGQTILGVILIIVGAVLLTYKGFTTTKETARIEVGDVRLSAKEPVTYRVSPWIGGAVLAAGVVVVVMGVKQK
ncbi:hypothetical protein KBB96_20545 [Luteolibacter ambystomatis]|uniref:DUF3185 domain-containing protein n=1 Tax=Luteolibacter ambystomatis TaxID=2824561 RepID=A0A975G9K3_9BACT|nr:hypothetical protein [Luteolibacter ambystomatis]QUE51230.1 hypothetical protein KBB96_20545 [Luteolibacter ambystomatis]